MLGRREGGRAEMSEDIQFLVGETTSMLIMLIQEEYFPTVNSFHTLENFINKTFTAENIKITEFYNKLKTKFNTDEEI